MVQVYHMEEIENESYISLSLAFFEELIES